MLDFTKNYYEESFVAEQQIAAGLEHYKTTIPTSNDISGIEIRLSNLFIIDNKTPVVWPFPGNANLYLLNIIISDKQSEPIFLQMDSFEKVNDNESLNVDRTLFYWKQDEKKDDDSSPSQIHVMSSIIKSKRGLRKAGEIMASAKNDNDFGDLSKTVVSLMSNATLAGQISNVLLNVASIVGKYLEDVEDVPLFTRYISFTDLGGSFNELGKFSFPASNKYCKIDYSLYIRDKDREK